MTSWRGKRGGGKKKKKRGIRGVGTLLPPPPEKGGEKRKKKKGKMGKKKIDSPLSLTPARLDLEKGREKGEEKERKKIRRAHRNPLPTLLFHRYEIRRALAVGRGRGRKEREGKKSLCGNGTEECPPPPPPSFLHTTTNAPWLGVLAEGWGKGKGKKKGERGISCAVQRGTGISNFIITRARRRTERGRKVGKGTRNTRRAPGTALKRPISIHNFFRLGVCEPGKKKGKKKKEGETSKKKKKNTPQDKGNGKTIPGCHILSPSSHLPFLHSQSPTWGR